MKTELSQKDVAKVTQGLIQAMLEENRAELELLTPIQVAGILDVQVAFLRQLPIPRITLAPGKIYRYRLADVKAWLAENRA